MHRMQLDIYIYAFSRHERARGACVYKRKNEICIIGLGAYGVNQLSYMEWNGMGSD